MLKIKTWMERTDSGIWIQLVIFYSLLAVAIKLYG